MPGLHNFQYGNSTLCDMAFNLVVCTPDKIQYECEIHYNMAKCMNWQKNEFVVSKEKDTSLLIVISMF